MPRNRTDFLWVIAMAVLVAFAIPWFMWRDSTTVAGLPVWLWWHVGWLALASVVFYGFTRGAWDRGIDAEVIRRG
ncbi:DUF3311 domain-containing protein [Halobaculum sp. D14]|uniref:DUF3311 domain-containing protein n=1 Tax=unclassified Halobaculum TaxID=2640896 RepID=UPI003EB85F30